jgi:hypothetical protein
MAATLFLVMAVGAGMVLYAAGTIGEIPQKCISGQGGSCTNEGAPCGGDCPAGCINHCRSVQLWHTVAGEPRLDWQCVCY